MIYISLYNRITCSFARCVKISNRFLQCLKVCYTRPMHVFKRTTGDWIAGPTATRIFLRLPAHILVERKKCILLTDNTCIRSSHIRILTHFDKAKVEIATSLCLIFNRSVRLSDLIALSTEDIKIMTAMRPLIVCNRVLVFRVKLKFIPSFETLDQHLLLRREKT